MASAKNHVLKSQNIIARSGTVALASLTGLPDPDVIRIGQILMIPGLTKKYKVVAGDTLSALADTFYGDSSMSELIAAANHISDPDFIEVGQILRMPDLDL